MKRYYGKHKATHVWSNNDIIASKCYTAYARTGNVLTVANDNHVRASITFEMKE